VLANEEAYTKEIPQSVMYEKSYMHKDTVTHIQFTSSLFLITASIDGYVKFWKKIDQGIDFVKTFRAHMEPISDISVSEDGLYLATISADKTLKVFDIKNFDMINMIKLDFVPKLICWIYQSKHTSNLKNLIACSDSESNKVYIYDGKGTDLVKVVDKFHSKPVYLMKYNSEYDCIISVDEKGIIEYWNPDTLTLPSAITFEMKSETDLYEFAKSKAKPLCLVLSQDKTMFAAIGSDRFVRVFNFLSGKLRRKFDETISYYTSQYKEGLLPNHIDEMEFGRRVALERELEKYEIPTNAIFDETGYFLIYPTMLGIKVVNLVANKLVRYIGTQDSQQRFLNLTMYQGAPKLVGRLTVSMAASDNPTIQDATSTDPTLCCTGYKKNRFYLYSKRDPRPNDERDVLNEKIIKKIDPNSLKKKELPAKVTLHTDLGDINIEFFDDTPKAVENFTTLGRTGYYNGSVFHRCIRGFMIQGGDPTGSGCHGQSMWGKQRRKTLTKAMTLKMRFQKYRDLMILIWYAWPIQVLILMVRVKLITKV
jgi:peptidylprolyl isomerase domain and WD repeat-containing protein 1